MDRWVSDNLTSGEVVDIRPTIYTNNRIALKYLENLIKHTRAGPNKKWNIILLYSHESYDTDEFKLKALENHNKSFFFPFHSTYALQPLDFGIFRPWKHYHSLVIQNAL